MNLRPTSPAAIIRRYYCYEIASSVGFITPIFTLFLLYRGLSFTEVGTLSAILAVLIVVGEIPTGYIGDRIGRRNSLVLSMLFTALSLAGFVFATSFLSLAILYGLWSLAMTFASGSEQAWLYDTLKEHLDEGRFTDIRGRANAVHMWTSAITMIAGSLLYVLHPTLPFAASAALNILAVPVLLSLPKNRQFTIDGAQASKNIRNSNKNEVKTNDKSIQADPAADEGHFTILDALPILRETFARPPLRSFVVYVGLLFGIIMATNVFVQPIAVEVFDDHLATFATERLGVGVEVSMGLLYAGFMVASAVASYYAGSIEDALGLDRAIVIIPILTGVAVVIPALVPLFAVPMFFTLRTSHAILNPMVNQYLNDHAPSVGRATVLSAASMIYALLRVPLTPTAGVVADWTNPLVGVAALGVLFLVGATLVFAIESPVDVTMGKPVSDSAGD